MAVDQDDELLYVLDPANGAILKYDASTPTAPVLADFSALASPAITEQGDPPVPLAIESGSDIAVDNSGGPNDGTIYVVTGDNTFFDPGTDHPSTLLAFAADGSFLYQLENAFGIAIEGMVSVGVANSGAVAGDIYLVDPAGFGAGSDIKRYADQPGGAQPTLAETVAIAANSFQVGESIAVTGDGTSIYTGPGATRYDATGAQQAQLPTPNGSIAEIKVDPATERIYASQNQVGGNAIVSEFSGAGEPEPDVLTDRFGSGQLGTAGSGVAILGNPSTVYASDTTAHEIDVFTAAIVPDVTSDSAAFASTTEADLSGTVDPLGNLVTTCEFQYGTDTTYGQSVPCEQSPGDGTGPVPVSATIGGLVAGETYHFRLHAANADGDSFSTDRTYVAAGPHALTGEPGPITRRGGTALLGGTVDPNGQPTDWWIEYGTEADLSDAQSSPASEDLDAGDGDDPAELTYVVDGLEPDTTYYFRIVAKSPVGGGDFGTDRGAIKSFATLPAADPEPTECSNAEFRQSGSPGSELPGCRAYEKVSPADTNGGSIIPFLDITNPDGSRVTFGSDAAFAGVQSLGLRTAYLATRDGEDGWRTEGLAAPSAWKPGADLSKAWMPAAANRELTQIFGAVAHLDLPGADTRQSMVGRGADGVWHVIAPAGRAGKVHAVPDSTGAVFLGTDQVQVTEGPTPPPDPNPSDSDPYRYLFQASADGSEIELVSIDQNGNPLAPDPAFPSIYAALAGSDHDGSHAVSDDGSHVFFTSPGLPPSFNGVAEILLRIDGERTELVSAPEPDAPPQTTRAKNWQGATPDGAVAFFTSTEKLTADATATPVGSKFDLYRYDVASGDLTDLTTGDLSGGGVEGTLGYSDDGSRVYFQATGNLTPDADGGDKKIYLADPSGLTLIADGVTDQTVSFAGTGNPGFRDQKQARVSPDGRYLLYASASLPSVYPNGGRREYYRYDAQSGRTDCVSCAPNGTAPTNDDFLSMPGQYRGVAGSTPFAPGSRLTPGGEVVFATADPLVRRDTNGTFDVYIWDGDARMISSGRSVDGAWPTAMTEDASSIFFITRANLVAGDDSVTMDLYVAREGGGIAGQQVLPTSDVPCQGLSACREESLAPPQADAPETERSTPNAPAPSCKSEQRKLDRAERKAKRAQRKAGRGHRKLRKLRRKAKHADGKRARKLRKRTKRARGKTKRLDRKAGRTDKREERAARRAARCMQGGAR